MALTVLNSETTVFGNMRVWAGEVTATAVTNVASFGMATIISVQATPASHASAPYTVRKNVNASGVASNGDIAVTGTAEGDDIHLVVFGR